MPEPRLHTKILLGCIPALLLLVVAEVAVRATGAADECSARFGPFFVCDPILGYKRDPDAQPLGKPLNSAGFRSREFEPKSDGVYRVLSIGDSCTFGSLGLSFVPEPYPQRLESIAGRPIDYERFEVLNGGMGGYNSYHGVMLLRTKLRDLDPDLITVKYGWNDLFVFSGDFPFQLPRSRIGMAFQDGLLRLHVYRFLKRLGHELRAREKPLEDRVRDAHAAAKTWKPSVALPDFKRHLRLIVELGRAQGADVWLLTSSRNPNPGETAVAQILERQRLSIPQLAEIQDSYTRAIREVGREVDAPVIDMAKIYQQHDVASFFIPIDVPHPIQAGHDLEAAALCEELMARGILRSCAEPAARSVGTASRKAARSKRHAMQKAAQSKRRASRMDAPSEPQ